MIDDHIQFRNGDMNSIRVSPAYPINITDHNHHSSPNNFQKSQQPVHIISSNHQTGYEQSVPNPKIIRVMEPQKSDTKDSNKKSGQIKYQEYDSFDNSESENEKEVIEDDEIVGKEQISNRYGLVVNKLKLKNNPSKMSNEKRSKKSSMINESRAKDERNSIYEFASERVFKIGSIKDDKSMSQRGSFGFSRNNNLEFGSNQKPSQFKNEYGMDIQNRRPVKEQGNDLYYSLYNNNIPKQIEPKYSTGRNVPINDFHAEIPHIQPTNGAQYLNLKSEYIDQNPMSAFAHFDDEKLMKEYRQVVSIHKSNLDNSIKKPQPRFKLEYPLVGVYDGEIENDCLNGYGRLYDDDNQLLYEGEFLNNNFEGLGILYNTTRKDESDWIRFEGIFMDNKKEGFGTYYFADDVKRFGFFRNDEQVDE